MAIGIARSDGVYPFTFLRWEGEPPRSSGVRVHEITRPGVDGSAWADIGIRGAPFTMRSVAIVDAASVDPDQLIADYALLQGAVCDFEDNFGGVWYYAIVREVRPVSIQKLVNFTGASVSYANAYRVVADWEMQF